MQIRPSPAPSPRLAAPRASELALAGLVALGLAACAGRPGHSPLASPADPAAMPGAAEGEAIRLVRSPAFDEITALEDRRSLGEGRLLAWAADADAAVRRRAVEALGRFPFPTFGAEVTDALCRALEDPEPAVKGAAAFALGLRADPASGGVLMAYRNDPDPRLRARIVEAASKLADPQIHADLLVALRDSDLLVRIEAAVGTARWSADEANASTVDRALIDALRPYTLSTEPSRDEPAAQPSPELAWRLLYALSRRESPAGRGAFLEYALHGAPLEQLFAVRGLGSLAGDPEAGRVLAEVLSAEVAGRMDWRVAYEAAAALGRLADPRGREALLAAVEHPSSHVRAAALAALGRIPGAREEVLPKVRRGLLDLSTATSASALASFVRIVPPEEALRTLAERAADEDPIVRLGAVAAAAEIEGEIAVPFLRRLTADPSPLVATRAADLLATHADPETHALLRGLLAHPDIGLRLSAAIALREMADETDVAALGAAFRDSRGDVSTEVAFQALETLGAIGGEAARALVAEAAADPRPHVQRVARALLAERFGLVPPAAPPPEAAAESPPPLPGRDYPQWTHNPLVEIRTNHGVLVFELFPAEAPLHVVNFLELAAAGAYDGLIFHRVVPDFVVQGGDYRGDGNGAKPWRGEALRAEFTPRKHVRGSLGMPRNEDPDSGGSQIYITHRPTPHLDGRYTVFGELRAGGDVLDAIQVGDRILGVKLRR
ncbi:MAG: HEAT repeat domain-containing protein [Planctomycetota bacterium]